MLTNEIGVGGGGNGKQQGGARDGQQRSQRPQQQRGPRPQRPGEKFVQVPTVPELQAQPFAQEAENKHIREI